jgi:hypothetical protein
MVNTIILRLLLEAASQFATTGGDLLSNVANQPRAGAPLPSSSSTEAPTVLGAPRVGGKALGEPKQQRKKKHPSSTT